MILSFFFFNWNLSSLRTYIHIWAIIKHHHIIGHTLDWLFCVGGKKNILFMNLSGVLSVYFLKKKLNALQQICIRPHSFFCSSTFFYMRAQLKKIFPFFIHFIRFTVCAQRLSHWIFFLTLYRWWNLSQLINNNNKKWLNSSCAFN